MEGFILKEKLNEKQSELDALITKLRISGPLHSDLAKYENKLDILKNKIKEFNKKMLDPDELDEFEREVEEAIGEELLVTQDEEV